ncbi:uncharacterized protein [Dendropsophus ebraccatus]|uniref:uncharacterized protein isoform X2 n=1 Tax=Dendropsophus ebraccatus TaxID=150705 RepID=UPI0038322932
MKNTVSALCIISAFISTDDGSQEIFIKRDCLQPIECNARDSFTTPVLRTSYATTCCTTEKCIPATPILPTENNTKNGVFCPACFSSTTDNVHQRTCVAKHSIECMGEEKSCISYQKEPIGGNTINAMGCASTNVCKENGEITAVRKPRSMEQVTCANVSNDVTLPTGHFIWCYFCHNYNVQNCTDEPYLCLPDEDVCVFERIKNIYDGREDVEITKRCGKSHECKRAGSVRSSTKTIFMNTTCCHDNVCEPPLPALPSADSDENGLTCPACFVPNSDRCLGRSDLKCIGNEQRCIHYLKTEMQDISTVTESLHGCTTKEICEAGSGLSYAKGQYYKTIKTDVMCSRAVGWRAPLCTILLSMAITLIVLTLIISL